MAGYRFSLEDERLLKLLQLVHRAFQISEMSGGEMNQMPCLRYIAPTLLGYNELKAFIDEMLNFMHVMAVLSVNLVDAA